jgi:hypothetical protein
MVMKLNKYYMDADKTGIAYKDEDFEKYAVP